MTVQIEYEILGGFLLDETTHTFLDNLQEDDFTDLFCKKCLSVMKDLRAKEREITIFNIQEVSNIKLMDLVNVQKTIATTARTESNIKTLKELSNRRQLLKKAEAIKELVRDKEKTITEIKNDIIQQIDDIQEMGSDEVVTLKDGLFQAYEELEKRYQNRGDTTLYTGLARFDSATAGLHREELTTIAARPGVGKTIIGLQIALNIANRGGKVIYTSLEMSITQLCERIIAGGSDIDSHKLRTGNIADEKEWATIQRTISRFQKENLMIDRSSANIQHIRAKLRKYKPDLLVIDYLQLLHPVNKEYSREREVAVITRDLKRMTQEFNIPIVILAQLNRNAEGTRPTMADLRESGAIEQDSDNVIFLHEPKDKEITELISSGKMPKEYFDYLRENQYSFSYIIIEKQRNGPTGTIKAIKKPKYMKFEEVD